jgi:hypothetical protein
MNARDTYSGKYLRVTDLKARRVPTRIQGVEEVEFTNDGKTEKKLVLTLRGLDKLLVLNRTNAETIIDTLGTEETDDWVGKPITLVQAKVRFQGKSTPCIRIEEPGEVLDTPLPGEDEAEASAQ